MTFQAAHIDPAAFRTFDLASAYNDGQKVGEAMKAVQDENAYRRILAENPDVRSEGFLTRVMREAPSLTNQVTEWQGQMADREDKALQRKMARKEHAIELAVKGAEFLKDLPPEQHQAAWQNWIAPLHEMDPEMHSWASNASLPHMMALADQRKAKALSDAKQAEQEREWQHADAMQREGWNHSDASQQAGFQHADASQQAGFAHDNEIKTLETATKAPPADFMTKGKSIMDLESALNQYRDLVKDYGTEVVPGQNKAALRSAYTNLQMKLKEAMNLGVLNGPDLERIGSMITDPTSLGGVGQSVMNMGSNPYLTQIDEVATDLGNTRKNLESIYGRQIPQAAQGVSRTLTKTGIDQRTGKPVTLILKNGQWVQQ